jgi:hypothetical protein
LTFWPCTEVFHQTARNIYIPHPSSPIPQSHPHQPVTSITITITMSATETPIKVTLQSNDNATIEVGKCNRSPFPYICTYQYIYAIVAISHVAAGTLPREESKLILAIRQGCCGAFASDQEHVGGSWRDRCYPNYPYSQCKRLSRPQFRLL